MTAVMNIMLRALVGSALGLLPHSLNCGIGVFPIRNACSYTATYLYNIYIYMHTYIYISIYVLLRRGSSYIGSHETMIAVMHILREVP
jgi:hypothetical protein